MRGSRTGPRSEGCQPRGMLSTAQLVDNLPGRVIGPDDPEYDQARAVFYGGFEERRPAAIVRVADANAVARVVAFAREKGWIWPSAAAAIALRVTASPTAASCSTSRA